MRARIAPVLAALAPLAAAAAEPELAVYVTDEGRDAFAALYAGAAVALEGCATAAEARALLGLPAAAPAAETTRAALEAEAGLGTRPRLPCAPADFALDWPATTPLWADLEGAGLYVLPAPAAGGYFAVPSACVGIKAALALRERAQLPGVLRREPAPADLGAPFVLGCGAGAGPDAPAAGGAGGWSLHRFQTFLSAESAGDAVLVLRHADGGAAAYLAVARLDGAAVPDLLLAGGEAAAAAERATAALVGLPADAPVTPLGAEAVAAVLAAPFVELCAEGCPDGPPRHGAFPEPGVSLALAPLDGAETRAVLDRTGAAGLVWRYAGERSLRLTGCERLAAALGLPAPPPETWAALAEAAAAAGPSGGGLAGGLDCRRAGPDLCVRRLAEGEALAQPRLEPGADCPGARRLRIELPAAARLAGPLTLDGRGFAAVTLAPAEGVGRVRLTGAPGAPRPTPGACWLAGAPALVSAAGLGRLELDRVDLAPDAAAPGAVVVQVSDGALALTDAGVNREAEGVTRAARGAHLCRAELYLAGGAIEAGAVALSAVATRALVTGGAEAPAALAAADVGAALSGGAEARFERVAVTAAAPVILRGAALTAAGLTLAPRDPAAAAASGLWLERGATARVATSTVRGFRCVAGLADAASRATFVVPGNDLARDNRALGCGPGRFDLLE